MPPCQQKFAISVHVCVCMHVYMCGGTPHHYTPIQPDPHPPELQGAQNIKIQ